MSFTLKPVALALSASACLCVAGTVYAQETTECTIDPSVTGVDTTIVVASNFFDPAKDLLADFFAANYPFGGEPTIRLCHDATGQINRDIRGIDGATPPGVIGKYSLFLAANASTPDALVGTVYVPVGASSFLYAKGIPVILGKFNPTNTANKISSVTELMPSLTTPPNPRAHSVPGTVTSANAIDTTNAALVAIANYNDAPYGLAAVKILKDMALWDYTTQPTPAWVRNPLFPNIGQTLDALNNEVTKTAFISKAQVCGALANYTYIQFDGYLLDQKGILIDTGDATQNALAASIKDFMMANSDPTYWSGFLTAHCYK